MGSMHHNTAPRRWSSKSWWWYLEIEWELFWRMKKDLEHRIGAMLACNWDDFLDLVRSTLKAVSTLARSVSCGWNRVCFLPMWKTMAHLPQGSFQARHIQRPPMLLLQFQNKGRPIYAWLGAWSDQGRALIQKSVIMNMGNRWDFDLTINIIADTTKLS